MPVDSKPYAMLLNTEDQAARIEQLQTSLATWTRSHTGLQNGDAELGLEGQNSPEVLALFARIEPNYVAMREAAICILQLEQGSAQATGEATCNQTP